MHDERRDRDVLQVGSYVRAVANAPERGSGGGARPPSPRPVPPAAELRVTSNARSVVAQDVARVPLTVGVNRHRQVGVESLACDAGRIVVGFDETGEGVDEDEADETRWMTSGVGDRRGSPVSHA